MRRGGEGLFQGVGEEVEGDFVLLSKVGIFAGVEDILLLPCIAHHLHSTGHTGFDEHLLGDILVVQHLTTHIVVGDADLELRDPSLGIVAHRDTSFRSEIIVFVARQA